MAMVLPRIKWHGTTAQRMSLTAEAGVIGYDTDLNQLCVFDGVTLGGRLIQFDTGSSYHPDLFDVKWADHICNDVQWLRADTFSWQSGAVYQVAYQHLADDIDGKTLQSETIGSTTTQFYLADDGHKICPASEESNVSAIYNATGVAWYYIIDTVNERFKLPRTKLGFTGLRDSVGNYIEPALPNITGSFRAYGANITGAFKSTATGQQGGRTDASNAVNISFKASDSSTIYKDGATVQSPATQMYLYLYVGQFTQTALENTAGVTTEVLNTKVTVGHEVVEFQAPTAANNYTWYRKYADGWVEQGGSFFAFSSIGANTASETTLNLILPMANTDYIFNTNGSCDNYSAAISVSDRRTYRTVSSLMIGCRNFNGSSANNVYVDWEIKGMAA